MGSQVSQLNITPELFDKLRTYSEFQEILRDLDISDEVQLDLFDTLDVDGGGTIDLEELITGIAKLRGDARRSDIVGDGLIVRAVQMNMNDFESTTMHLLNSYGKKFKALETGLQEYKSQKGASVKGDNFPSKPELVDDSLHDIRHV